MMTASQGQALTALRQRIKALCDDAEDRRDWISCADLRAVIEPAPMFIPEEERTENADTVAEPLKGHAVKGTNAEDCPICARSNPPYPFLCDGDPIEAS